jgi:hypothetical protein
LNYFTQTQKLLKQHYTKEAYAVETQKNSQHRLRLFLYCSIRLQAAPLRKKRFPRGEAALSSIIMYHEVKPTMAGKDVIMPWEFESESEISF